MTARPRSLPRSPPRSPPRVTSTCALTVASPNCPSFPPAVLLLFYTFAGVGIVADAFMDAITVITSVGRWHATVDPRTGLQQSVHIKRWNPTVANLTLMALGSSAPEIMLSIIEIVAGNYYSGELGPSTIVGSAAFNMLVILAVCESSCSSPPSPPSVLTRRWPATLPAVSKEAPTKLPSVAGREGARGCTSGSTIRLSVAS